MVNFVMRPALLALALLALCSFAAPSDVDQNQVNNPYGAPIFRDRNEDNTVTSTTTQSSASKQVTGVVQSESVDVAAYVKIEPWSRSELNIHLRKVDPSPMHVAYCHYFTTMDKLINLLSNSGPAVKPMALRLGSSGNPGETLGSDFTNYAPDNFSDLEIMKLFEINQMLRDSGHSSSEGMKRVNERMLRAYIHALAGLKPIGASESLDEKEECSICEIGLIYKKPCVEYPCGHVYHQKCALESTAKQHEVLHMCPQCKSFYRVPLVEPNAKV